MIHSTGNKQACLTFGKAMEVRKELLGKPASQMTLDDLSDFFASGPNETQYLEFKSGQVESGKLLKEICAFLNAEGGLLILGAPRQIASGKAQLDLSPIPDKQILLRQITGGIQPAPEGIVIHQLPSENGSAFLIEVPPSPTPPHQLPGSGQYYVRQGAVSRPAMHEEVERMFLEKRQPALDLQIEIERPDDALLIRLIIGNKSSISAFEPGFSFQCFPVRFQDKGRFDQQMIAQNNYLAQGQRWVKEINVYPSEPRFFIHCQYFSRDVKPRLKAAFAEIIHHKVELLSVYNSDLRSDFDLWYEENLYLLND